MSYERKEEGMEDYAFEPEPMGDASVREEKPATDVELALKLLRQVQDSLASLASLLEGKASEGARGEIADLITSKKAMVKRLEDVSGSRIVEGVFDGACMVGSDGRTYAVPPNYASKSRLVEGDVLKLTIKPDGGFLYKQIAPVERRRVVGKLAFDASTHSFVALCEGSPFKLLTASVTYFKGEPGDEAVLLVPKGSKCVWAAVENIIKR